MRIPTGKRSHGDSGQSGRDSPASRTLLSFRASQPVQPWDLGKLSQGIPQLEVMTFCFLLGRAVICILLREDSVPLPFGLAFLSFYFFRSLSKATALPPTHRSHLPLESGRSSPALLAVSSWAGEHLWSWPPAPLPAPHLPSLGRWVSAQSHLWTDTVFLLTMRISNDPFTFGKTVF